jgi:FkbM family methyltransferase
LVKHSIRRHLARRGFALVRQPRPLLLHDDAQLIVSFDMILSRYLLGRKHPPNFIQVGAFNGVDGDPLHSYIQRGLLKGCVIEPQSEFFEQLKANYDGIEDIVFKRAAIGPATSIATLYRVRPGTPGPSWLYQIASLRREVLLKHASVVPGLEAAIVTETVPVTTFDELFAELGFRPDIVVIDTEGYDYEIIKRLYETGCRPDLILYEHRHLSELDKEACLQLLIDAGYCAAVGADTIALLAESAPSIVPTAKSAVD